MFDDLALSRAEVTEAKVKAELWRELVNHIGPLKLTQTELARRLNVHQPEASCLLNGKLSKFSVGTLIQYAVRLNLGVQVKITSPAKAKKSVVKKISAKAAGYSKAKSLALAAGVGAD